MFVTCNDSDHRFNIHKVLLETHAPGLDITEDSDGGWVAQADTSSKTFDAFGKWLYSRTSPIDISEPFDSQIPDLVAAHAFGRAVRCVGLMDAVLDAVIDAITKEEHEFCVHELINPFVNEFPPKSAGRELMFDLIIYARKMSCDIGCARLDELEEIDDETVVIELAQRIMAAKGVEVAQRSDNLDFSTLLVVGFLNARDRGHNNFDPPYYPWVEDRCQYHRHRELGLRCHQSKV